MAEGYREMHGIDAAGTTASRPTAADVGCHRYNTTTSTWEVYDGSNWKPVASSFISFVYGEATPLDASFVVVSRAMRVVSITVRPLVVGSDGSAVTGVVKKVASGTAIASGTALHSGTIDFKGTINTNQSLTLSTTDANLQLASGDAVGIDVTGTTTSARGVISIEVVPI